MVALAAVVVVALNSQPPAFAQSQSAVSAPRAQVTAGPTFSRDIAPIFQRTCQACHQPAGIGPMSFLTYEEVRPWAPLIKNQVERRIMPPWHLDKTVGIQEYKNDISLTDQEIATIGRWVEAGAPQGNPADLPPPVRWPAADEWELAARFGPPDLVVRSTPYTVQANGQDQFSSPSVAIEGIPRPRWIRAAEFKPSYPLGVRVVHHGHANFTQGDYFVQLVVMGVGKRWEVLPEGVGKYLPAGPAEASFSLHWFPIGEEVKDDVVEAGVWFYPEGYEPELATRGEVQHNIDGTSTFTGMADLPQDGRVTRHGLQAADILIPPHGHAVFRKEYVMEKAALIQSFRPHMHMRGTGMTMEAIYPDGRREVLSAANNYSHNWQIAYIYEDHAQPLLPRGTVLVLHSYFDNTANNPINPDPDQWVVFGGRGVDEMSHAWISITYMDDEVFSRLVSERERLLAERARQSQLSDAANDGDR